MERLQKYMANSGVASRRASEQIIAEGRVKVNDKIITEMGFKVSKGDVVKVDNKIIEKVTIMQYFVINKPQFVISTVSDPKGRKTVISVLPEELQNMRLFPVGRLDYDTKGVLLLTNDGEFMEHLVGPKSNTEKEYLARVKGIPTKSELLTLERGVVIDNYKTRKCKAYIKSIDKKSSSALVGIIIREGKNHQVKKMMESIGYPVVKLSRIRFGNITIDKLVEGEVRALTIHEIKVLMSKSIIN